MKKRIQDACVTTAVLTGCRAALVTVEVQVSKGIPRFTIIGLADAAIREAKERVMAALQSLGIEPPDQVLVNLAPAELRKEGAALDVAIAAAILLAMGLVPSERLSRALILGELGLGGEIKAVQGVIAYGILAQQEGLKLVIPRVHTEQLSVIPGITGAGLEHMRELVEGFRESRFTTMAQALGEGACRTDFSEIIGQESAKRALVIAAAGGHNVLLVGPPGCGKTMLARALVGILPELTVEERLEVSSIHSVAGLSVEEIIRGVPPFRAPHYTMSEAGLLGGGALLRPGEATLGHRGVLFLDEFPEFRRSVIEALRLPLESGAIALSRVGGKLELPARFQLIAAMNPCPCGRLSNLEHPSAPGMRCECSQGDVYKYRRKLSGPILDRIDLHVTLSPVPLHSLAPAALAPAPPVEGVSSDALRTRVSRARSLQYARQGACNSATQPALLKTHLRLSNEASRLLRTLTDRAAPSARSFQRILKVARTIADLEGDSEISKNAIAEAFSFRATSFP